MWKMNRIWCFETKNIGPWRCISVMLLQVCRFWWIESLSTKSSSFKQSWFLPIQKSQFCIFSLLLFFLSLIKIIQKELRKEYTVYMNSYRHLTGFVRFISITIHCIYLTIHNSKICISSNIMINSKTKFRKIKKSKASSDIHSALNISRWQNKPQHLLVCLL